MLAFDNEAVVTGQHLNLGDDIQLQKHCSCRQFAKVQQTQPKQTVSSLQTAQRHSPNAETCVMPNSCYMYRIPK